MMLNSFELLCLETINRALLEKDEETKSALCAIADHYAKLIPNERQPETLAGLNDGPRTPNLAHGSA